mmetsp:Transcript_16021/g.47545  ORF Transcript_16021/g.47545 Transcript_16021/m.47545 type:complete len:258 (+) Transcript_16021:2383-3156(+)
MRCCHSCEPSARPSAKRSRRSWTCRARRSAPATSSTPPPSSASTRSSSTRATLSSCTAPTSCPRRRLSATARPAVASCGSASTCLTLQTACLPELLSGCVTAQSASAWRWWLAGRSPAWCSTVGLWESERSSTSWVCVCTAKTLAATLTRLPSLRRRTRSTLWQHHRSKGAQTLRSSAACWTSWVARAHASLRRLRPQTVSVRWTTSSTSPTASCSREAPSGWTSRPTRSRLRSRSSSQSARSPGSRASWHATASSR